MNNRFTQALFDQKRKTEQRNPLIAGTLGITLNGQTIVEVPDRPSYVYVQVRSSTAEVIQAFNAAVSPVYGLPVFIQWQGNRYAVTERDTMRYSNWVDFSSYLPRHASTHEWSGSAGDVVFVSQQQFLPLMPMPSGSSGNGSVVINDYNLMSTGGTFSYFPAQATQNLTVWNPLSSTGAIMVLVSIDAATGLLRYDVGSGTVFGNWLTGTADVLPKVPAVPDLNRYLPVAAIRLVTGVNAITWDNIYDVRPLFGVTRGLAGGGGAGSVSTISGFGPAILDEGILLGTGAIFNFVGAGVTATISGATVNVSIPGGGGGGASGSDATYLRLDATNSPVTGPLDIQARDSFLPTLHIGNSGTQQGIWIEQLYSLGNAAALEVDVYTGTFGNPLVLFSAQNADGPVLNIQHWLPSVRKAVFAYPSLYLQRLGGVAQSNFTDAGYVYDTSVGVEQGGAFRARFNGGTDYMILNPFSSGSVFTPPFPGNAPYHFDTKNALPTGRALFEVLHNTRVVFWLGISGELSAQASMNIPKGSTYNIAGSPHTHPLTNLPVDQIGIFGQDEGVPLGTGTIMNFVGAGVTASISGTVIQVNVPGGGGGGGVDQIGIFAEDEGIPLGTGTVINFRGSPVVTTISGTVIDVFLTGSAGAQGPAGPAGAFGMFVESEGAPLGTGTILNVRGTPVVASISGSTVDLYFKYPARYFSGLELALTGSQAVQISAGAARDVTDTYNLNITGVLIKVLTGTWTEGNNGLGLDAGVIAANTWYHAFAIYNPTSNKTDIVFSASATNPTLPSGYVAKRLVGSVRTKTSGIIMPFIQYGDYTEWNDSSMTLDINSSSIGSGSRTLFTMTLPVGYKVRGMFNYQFFNNTSQVGIYLSDPDVPDLAPSVTVYPTVTDYAAVAGQRFGGNAQVITNVSGQIGARGTLRLDTTLTVSTLGWRYLRQNM